MYNDSFWARSQSHISSVWISHRGGGLNRSLPEMCIPHYHMGQALKSFLVVSAKMSFSYLHVYSGVFLKDARLREIIYFRYFRIAMYQNQVTEKHNGLY